MATPAKPQSRSRRSRGPDAHQNQHLVPRQHFQTEPHDLVELFKLSPGWQQEFDFERGRYNLQRLPEFASGGNEQRSSVHRGAHPSINDIMGQSSGAVTHTHVADSARLTSTQP